MIIKSKLLLYVLLFCPIILKTEIHYSHKGYIDIGTIHRLSDGSMIKIPYRMMTYEPVISYKNFNLVTNTALEFRLKDIHNVLESHSSLDIRELYLEWMLPLGEISI